jgi:hypothetical protein
MLEDSEHSPASESTGICPSDIRHPTQSGRESAGSLTNLQSIHFISMNRNTTTIGSITSLRLTEMTITIRMVLFKKLVHH